MGGVRDKVVVVDEVGGDKWVLEMGVDERGRVGRVGWVVEGGGREVDVWGGEVGVEVEEVVGGRYEGGEDCRKGEKNEDGKGSGNRREGVR